MKVQCATLFGEMHPSGASISLEYFTWFPGRPDGGYVIRCAQESDNPDLQAETYFVLPEGLIESQAIRKAVALMDELITQAARRRAIWEARQRGGWSFCAACGCPLKVSDGVVIYYGEREESIVGDSLSASCPWCGEGSVARRLVGSVTLPQLVL